MDWFKQPRHIGDDSNIYQLYKFNPSKDRYGSGAYGVVYKATQIVTNKNCALKRVKKDGKHNAEMSNELAILSSIDHPHIMKVYQLLESENYYYISSEDFNGGELFSLLEEWTKNQNYNEKSVVKIIS